jgi:hypothetical protein
MHSNLPSPIYRSSSAKYGTQSYQT